MTCPRCGDDITFSYEEADPDVGILHATYWCEACEESVPADDDIWEE